MDAAQKDEAENNKSENKSKTESQRKIQGNKTVVARSGKAKRNKRSENDKKQWTAEEEKQALAFNKDPDLLQRFLKDTDQVYTGRKNEKIVLKLVFTTRKILNNKKGTGVIVRGPSSVGKSDLVGVVLITCAENDKRVFTRITTNYLLYTEESYARKILVIHELPGADNASLTLRTGLSESTLKVGTVEKNRSGQLSVRENEIDATGMVLVTTTTRAEIDFELGTRVIFIDLEHDPDIAGEAYKLMANNVDPKSKIPNLRIWQVADNLLKPRNVQIPFANKVAETFPRNKERYLRDFQRVLYLIQASALLHQYQRPINKDGAVIATKEDYNIVYGLQSIIFPDICDSKLENFINAVKALRNNFSRWPTRKQVERHLQISPATVKRRVKNAKELGVIRVVGSGDEGVIQVIAELNILYPLPDPGEICMQ